MSNVHVLFRGQQMDFSLEELFPPERHEAIGIIPGTVITSSNITEDQIKAALSQKLDVGVGEFEDHFVENNPNGNVTVRPDTPFGI